MLCVRGYVESSGRCVLDPTISQRALALVTSIIGHLQGVRGEEICQGKDPSKAVQIAEPILRRAMGLVEESPEANLAWSKAMEQLPLESLHCVYAQNHSVFAVCGETFSFRCRVKLLLLANIWYLLLMVIIGGVLAYGMLWVKRRKFKKQLKTEFIEMTYAELRRRSEENVEKPWFVDDFRSMFMKSHPISRALLKEIFLEAEKEIEHGGKVRVGEALHGGEMVKTWEFE